MFIKKELARFTPCVPIHLCQLEETLIKKCSFVNPSNVHVNPFRSNHTNKFIASTLASANTRSYVPFHPACPNPPRLTVSNRH